MTPSIHTGDLTAQPGVVYQVTAITGALDASGADTRTAFPRLQTVGGWLYAYGADTRTAFPRLQTVGGALDAYGADTRTAFPRLQTVGGGLHAYGADTRTAFPRLQTVGGALDASGADTRTAFPRLQTVGGWLDASGADTRTAFPRLQTVGGGLYARGADTRTAFPRLQTVGGTLAAHGAHCPKLKTSGDIAALRVALARQHLTLDDGILCRILRRRGPVTRVQRIGSAVPSYLVTDGTHTAHGRTLAEARADLRVKQGPRDTAPYRGWTRERVVSLEDGIAAYRAVTGACGLGVEQFLASRRLPSRMPVSRIVTETAGQYGHEQFVAFLDAKGTR